MRQRALLLAVLALGLLGALWWSQQRSELVKVSGLLEVDDVRLGSRVGGRVRQVLVEEGQRVTAGQTLVELDPYDLMERQAQAAAQLAGAEADLQRLQQGFRVEEIAAAEAQHQRLAAVLERLQVGPRQEEIAAAQAAVAQAAANLKLAQLTFARTQEAFAGKAATQREMDLATQELEARKAALEVQRQQLAELQAGTRREQIAEAQAQLAQAKAEWDLKRNGYRPQEIAAAQAQVEAARAVVAALQQQVAELTVTAPVDGIIEAVDLRPGDLVAPNAPVLTMIDPLRLWVRAYVPENHLNLAVDHEVEVSVDSFPDRRFKGRVSYIARQGEFTPGNVQTPDERSKQVFRIKVLLAEGADVLRAGMAADVWLESAVTRTSAESPR